jgi:RNA-directed DNA polymerase
MKSLRSTLQQSATQSSIHAAYTRAVRSKSQRPEIAKFLPRKVLLLHQITKRLQTQAYTPSSYYEFTIHDPKTRRILALPIHDRIVHQWIVEEFIKPYYIPRFIAHTYACLPGRGTHAAVTTAQKFLCAMQAQTSTPYIIKLDIASFFSNIDKSILYELLVTRIRDVQLQSLLHTILFRHTPDQGIPIGNYTSQYFANIYLNELDQFIKRELKVRYYVRYMDDFICFVDGKAEARRIYRAIQLFLLERLRLPLNPKSRYYPADHGLDFCGYKIYPHYRKLRKRSKWKLCQIIDGLENGSDSPERFEARINAWLGHAMHANAHTYTVRKLASYQERFPRLAPKTAPESQP